MANCPKIFLIILLNHVMNEEWMMVDEFHVFYVKNEW